jgi:hypothetical protein
VWEPVGPLPASVYRRRRVAAVAAALVVLVVGIWAVSGDDEPDPAPVPESAATQPLAAPASTGPPECSRDTITVTAEVDRTEHPVGRQATLRLVVTNVGAQPCTRDLDPGRQEIMVISDDLKSRIWSSNDCENPSTPDVRTLQPNQPLGFRVPWNGRTSNPGCTEERESAPEGRYRVVTRLDDVYSEPVPLQRLP